MRSVISQLFRFMVVYRKFWLAPIIISLLLLGGALIAVQGSAVGPFLYALF